MKNLNVLAQSDSRSEGKLSYQGRDQGIFFIVVQPNCQIVLHMAQLVVA